MTWWWHWLRWKWTLWRCKHDGPQHFVSSGEMAGLHFALWRCDRCGADIFETD